jgi:hypothetical protein
MLPAQPSFSKSSLPTKISQGAKADDSEESNGIYRNHILIMFFEIL